MLQVIMFVVLSIVNPSITLTEQQAYVPLDESIEINKTPIAVPRLQLFKKPIIVTQNDGCSDMFGGKKFAKSIKPFIPCTVPKLPPVILPPIIKSFPMINC